MNAVEIENILLKHSDVDAVTVIGVPDDLRVQVVRPFLFKDSRERMSLYPKSRVLRNHDCPLTNICGLFILLIVCQKHRQEN